MQALPRLFTHLLLAFSLIGITLPAGAQESALQPAEGNPLVTLHTAMGKIEVELFAEQAPETVANFLSYAEEGFYDALIFHRVIEYFMIQTGGIDTALEKKPTRAAVKNESANGIQNTRGTLAMARFSDPDSAASQFFINVEDNPHLDAKQDKPGYTVFGQVVSGMEVADAISAVATETRAGFRDIPVEDVILEKVTIDRP